MTLIHLALQREIEVLNQGWMGDGGWGGQKGPLPKTYYTYPTIMKLGTVIPYLKKIQKIYESRVTHFEFC